MSIDGVRAIAGAASGRARLQRRGTLAIASLVVVSFASAAAHAAPSSQRAAPRCLSECTPRIGIVSAFGAEAEILIAETRAPRSWSIGGNRFTTGVLRGNPVVIVLSGVSMVNAAMTTQRLLDHFRIERLVMSGIAGGIDPSRHVGDVLVPESWTMPMEVYWSHDAAPPAPCGAAGELQCLGLALARPEGRAVAPYVAPGASASGLFMRENRVVSASRPEGEFVFDYRVDPEMLAVARTLAPTLARCGPKANAEGTVDPKLCVGGQPTLVVGGRGVSGTAFLADPAYRRYLFEQLGAQSVDMETAAVAHVARANGVPFIGFRSLSDLAGAETFNADVGALFASGLAERNASALTLAFLAAWAEHERRPGARP
jgi:adenosylhomocysteine nucleosidase